MNMNIFNQCIILTGACFFFFSGCVVPLKVPLPTGSTQAPQIDFVRLLELAEAAGHAYETDATIESVYGKSNVVIRDFSDLNIRYFIFFNKSKRTQTISIRGTANKSNAWADIDSLKVLDIRLNIFLHKGFKLAADQIYADAGPYLHKKYKTRLTGHSLGGAVASILMMNMIHDGYQIEQALTFGQPKITNENGGTEFNTAPYFRIINGQDLVPQVPPSNLLYDFSGPYQHFGPEITLLADKKWTFSPVHNPKDLLTNGNWKQLDLENGTDHQIKNYIERLKS